MPFVTRTLHTGWRVQAKRDWASFPNEWAILRPSANGIIWKRLLEKKVRVGLRFGDDWREANYRFHMSGASAWDE